MGRFLWERRFLASHLTGCLGESLWEALSLATLLLTTALWNGEEPAWKTGVAKDQKMNRAIFVGRPKTIFYIVLYLHFQLAWGTWSFSLFPCDSVHAFPGEYLLLILLVKKLLTPYISRTFQRQKPTAVIALSTGIKPLLMRATEAKVCIR